MARTFSLTPIGIVHRPGMSDGTRTDPLTPDVPLARPVEGREDLPPVGLLATCSPRRPDPIGLSYPKLLGRNERHLHVSGMDAWPDTPVLDMKGYYLRDKQRRDATALWASHDAARGGPPPLRSRSGRRKASATG